MEDLISRFALLKALGQDKNSICSHVYSKVNHCDADELEKELEWIINSQPTVDAKPVVHGEWIDTQPEYHHGYCRNAHVCSNCHDYYTTEYDDLFYCPRCGAYMKGE